MKLISVSVIVVPLIAFIVLVFSVKMPHEDFILGYRGVETSALPSAVREGNIRVNKQDVYDIDVSFTDQHGQERRVTVSTLDEEVIAAAQAKKPLQIEYDPERPSRARLVGGSASAIGLMAFLPLGFSMFGVRMFFSGYFHRAKRRKLYREGTPAQARVQRLEPTGVKLNGKPEMTVHYSYQSPQGTADGELETTSPPELGSVIWVLFDPKKPKQNIAA